MTGLRASEHAASALAVVVAMIASLLAAGPSIAQEEAAPAEMSPADYFERIASAEWARYRARQLVVYMGDPQSAAVLDVRSGPDGRFVRAEAGSDVVRLWRNGRLGRVEGADASFEDVTSPAADIDTEQVLEKYEVGVGVPVDMLGVEVVPLSLVRRIDRAEVETLWVHAATGMVYRRELYGATGDLVGLTTILDMRWGERGEMETPDEAAPAPERVEASSDEAAPDRLSYGYELVHASSLDSGGATSTHWLYSDGLHALSVFSTPGGFRPPEGFEEASVEGAWVGPGPGTWAWEGDGASWVLVAEEPALDAEELTAALPRGGPSIWARLGSVWSRLFGWIADLF